MSTVSIRQQMRSLVDQFETGLLAQDEYRQLRTSLLDRAALGEYEAPEVSSMTRPREPAIAQEKPQPTAPRRKPDPTRKQSEDSKTGDSSSGVVGKWVALGALVIALLAAGWWFSQGKSESPTEVAMVVEDATSATGPMEELTTQFMQVDDWGLRVIREFSLSWQDFTPAQRQQAESSIWYRRFVRDLRDRLRLAELASDSVANDRATAISTLAAEMGIDVESRFADTRDVSAVKAAAEANNRAIAERQQQEELRREQEAEQQQLAEKLQAEQQLAEKLKTEQRLAEKIQAEKLKAENLKAEKAAAVAALLSPSKTSERSIPSPSTAQPIPKSDVKIVDSIDKSSSASQAKQVPQKVVVGTSTVPLEKIVDASEADPVDKTVVSTPSSPEANDRKTVTESTKAAAEDTLSKQDSGCNASQLATRMRFCRDTMADSTIGPKLALIREGSYRMGSTQDTSEQPVRTVTLAKGFAIGATEVTVSQYARFCKDAGAYCPENPWGSDSFPVVNVSHADASAYTLWLSKQTRRTYRLPSEAEWEYATRAGSDTEYPFGDTLTSSHAHFSSLRRQSQPLPANSGRPVANKFGLKHSVGNVSEWVADAWHDNYTGAPSSGEAFGSAQIGQGVVRGGSFADSPAALRSAARSSRASDTRDRRIGFRILRELD